MTDNRKKGDFDQWQRHDTGGNKKQDNSHKGRHNHQNRGHGGHR